MEKMFSIALNKNTEFTIIGIANFAKGTMNFQGLVNGTPFTENADYELIRSRVMKAVEINQPEKKAELS